MDPTNLTQIFTYAAAGAGALSLGLYLKTAFYTVQQQTEALITSFGKYVRTEKDPGLHLKWPAPFEKVAGQPSTATNQAGNTLETKTSNDLFVHLPITVQYDISDTKKYWFDSNKPVEQVMTLVDSSVRKHIAGKTFQDLYSMDRGTLSDEVISDIGEHAMSEYGIRIKRIVINQPEASQTVKDQYDKVQSSAMAAQQAENDGKASITREVAKAEGEKQRDFKRGEGAAGYRKKIFDQYNEQINALVEGGTPREEAVHVMMKIMQFDMLREVGEKGNLIIVTPDDVKGKEFADYQALARTVRPDKAGAAPAPAAPSLNS